MKVLVLNGSPKKEKSTCLRVTRAFLAGMNETAEFVNAVDLDVRFCCGTLACWFQTPGKCVKRDDMDALLPRITGSDLVIFSAPLYCYTLPACVKRVVERMMPLSTPRQEVDAQGHTHHPTRRENRTRFMLVSGSGFPNMEGNFEALIREFGNCFGADFPRILCLEAPLLEAPEAASVAEPYLAAARRAGEEFAAGGAISEATQRALDAPMIPPDVYRAIINGEAQPK